VYLPLIAEPTKWASIQGTAELKKISFVGSVSDNVTLYCHGEVSCSARNMYNLTS